MVVSNVLWWLVGGGRRGTRQRSCWWCLLVNERMRATGGEGDFFFSPSAFNVGALQERILRL
jgi:hypothetical protein